MMMEAFQIEDFLWSFNRVMASQMGLRLTMKMLSKTLDTKTHHQ
jgi:hypothetical protein